MAPHTPILPLLKVVFASILQVFLLCLAGYILAGKGILDKKTQRQLNKLNVSLFTPALLFSKVAFFLTPAKLRELWIIPILFVVVTGLSMGVAFLLGYLSGLKRSQRNFAMAAAMFMNSNSLPIALMQSLVVTVPGLKWDADDNKNAMLGRALTYLVLYSTLGMVLRWSYGVRLLAQADSEEPILEPSVHRGSEEQQPLLQNDSSDSEDDEPLHDGGNESATSTVIASSAFTEEPAEMSGAAPALATPAVPKHSPKPNFLRPNMKTRNSTFYRSFPNSPNQSRVDLPTIASEVSLSGGSETDVETGQHHHKAPSVVKRAWSNVVRFWWAFNDFMTVPLWAALASILVACIQPVQHSLDVHLTWVKGAISQLGNCSIPITLVVLGGYFYPERSGDDADRKRRQNLSVWASIKESFGFAPDGRPKAKRMASMLRKRGETKTVVIAVASRMLVVPLLMMPLMALGAYGDYQEVFADPVFVVSNVLLISSPPALTLAQITQAASGDAFERLISRTIFWSYCIITPPATIIYVVVGMLLARL